MTMISTKRLQLRPLHEGDTDGLVRGLNNFNVSKWTARVPFPYGMADAKSFLALCQKAEQDTLRLAITIDGELIGVISYERSQDGISAELGYWLARDHGGLGYMSEAVRALIRHLPDHAPDVALVFATTDPQNAASQSVLMRCGFDQTGTHRRQTPNRQGNRTVLRFERRISAAT